VGNPPYSASGNISQLPPSITGRYSLVTFTVTTTEGTVSQQVEPLSTCYIAPEYVPTVECTDNNGEFVVNVVNVGGEPVGGGVNILVSFAVINGGGTGADLIENAELPFTRTYTGPYQYVDVTVSSPDVEPVTAINETCYNPPVYVPYAECAEGQNGVFNFGFTNTGGEPIEPTSVSFTVTDENGTVLVQDSQFPPYNSSVSGAYSAVTLTIDSTQESAVAEACYVAPKYVAQLICADSVNGTFNGQIFNIGGTSDDVLTYSIVDSQNNEVASGSVDSLPFTIPPFNSTATGLTLFVYVNGDSIGATAEAGACYVEPPSFDSSLVCENNGTAVFTINVLSGELGDNTYPVIYTVDGNSQSAGTFSSDNTEFSVRGMSGKTITFSVVGLDSLTKTVECWDKSSVSVDGECMDGVIKFYVSNTGSEPMSAPTTWRLEDANGTELANGTIQLAGNETQTLTFPEFDGQTLRLWVD
ncbi:MAG: hypothetical protein KJ043_20425, partial [Anaerolineae bacterium]|nr:hypothetical protein [Anaerolineae bacterium]